MMLYSVNTEYSVVGFPEIKARKRLYVKAYDEKEAAATVLEYLKKKKNACDIRMEEPYVLPIINATSADLF